MKANSKTRSLRLSIIGASAVFALISLSSCAKDEVGSNGSCEGPTGSTCIKTIQYKGHPLNCISWNGYASETGFDCDWVEYHKKYGDTESKKSTSDESNSEASETEKD